MSERVVDIRERAGEKLLTNPLAELEADDTLSTEIAQLIGPRRERALAERALLKGRLAELNAEIARLDKVARSAGLDKGSAVGIGQPKKKAKEKPVHHRRTGVPANGSFARVVGYVAEQSRPVNRRDVMAALGTSDSQTQKALKDARDIGLIQEAKREKGGHGGQPAIFYLPYEDTLARLEGMIQNGK